MFDTSLFQERLNTTIIRPELVIKEEAESTNEIAKDLLREGATEGLIVIADTQTRGSGRRGRTWESPIGGLYMSLVLEPRGIGAPYSAYSLLAGCGTAVALKKATGLDVKLKWPNDLYLDSKKLGGILTELVVEKDALGMVIGIGINMNFDSNALSEVMKREVTSILSETGEKFSVELIAASIINEIDLRIKQVIFDESFQRIANESKSLSATLGKEVIAEREDESIIGLAVNIAEDGSLVIETKEGILYQVTSGEVIHLLEEDE